MALYNQTQLPRYVNGLRINLWYYLESIAPYIKVLTNPSRYNDWHVELRQLTIDEHSITFSVVLVVGETGIKLQDVSTDKGLADGRVQINDRGLWLDMSANGNPHSLMFGVPAVVLDNDVVVAPPAIATYNTYRVAVRDGLRASYTPTTNGGTLTLSVDRRTISRKQQEESKGIKSINGAVPIDGDLVIQGSGDVAVSVSVGGE